MPILRWRNKVLAEHSKLVIGTKALTSILKNARAFSMMILFTVGAVHKAAGRKLTTELIVVVI
jgi:hypothetical protein